MIKWIYDDILLERQELLFISCMVIILLIIIVTIFLVRKELKENKNAN